MAQYSKLSFFVNSMFGHQTACQICDHQPLTLIVPLGHQPPIHSFVDTKKLHEPEAYFPLNLCYCEQCSLWQLDYIGDPQVIFPPDYPYQTGLTGMLVRNFRELARSIIDRYGLTGADLVIDIGSNDGTLLEGFKERGIPTLGVEPTHVARIANERGIETVQAFFTRETAERIRKDRGAARVVTAANVFAHILDVPELMRAVDTVLADNGVFVTESQYLMDVVKHVEVDTIYHEHLRFYSLKSLGHLFEKYHMTLVDAERITAAGGSVRAYAMKGPGKQSDRLQGLLKAEEDAGLHRTETRDRFAAQALNAKRDLVALLLDIKKQGKTIAGLGSAGRSHSLLNFMRIDSTILSYNGEKTGSPKIGLFTPGTHIPIVDEARIFERQPEYLLVLSWHIGDELMKKIRSLGYKGTFILPLPEPRIVTHI